MSCFLTKSEKAEEIYQFKS